VRNPVSHSNASCATQDVHLFTPVGLSVQCLTYSHNNTLLKSYHLHTADKNRNESQQQRSMQLSPMKVTSLQSVASIYDRKAWPRLPKVCPWCLRWFNSTIETHITSNHHKHHIFYEEYRIMKKNDPKNYMASVKRLHNQGRCRNNIRALEQRDRQIIPARRVPQHKQKQHEEKQVWCMLCKTAVSKKALRESHLQICAKRKELKLTKANSKLVTKNAEPLIEPEAVTIERLLEGKDHAFKEVLYPLKKDRLAIIQFVMNDAVAFALLSTLISNGRNKANYIPQTRSTIRIAFNILLFFLAQPGLKCKTLLDVMDYNVWHFAENGELPLLVKCCHANCGYDPQTHTFRSPNEVMSTSSVVQNVADIGLNHLHHSDEDKREKMTKNATAMLSFTGSTAWKNFTVRPAARQKAAQINFRSILVPQKDLEYYMKHLDNKAKRGIKDMICAYKARDKEACREAHIVVTEALPSAIGTYCYRRLAETYILTISDFQRRPDMTALQKTYGHTMTVGELDQVKRLFTFEHRTKHDNPVITLAKVEYMNTLILLCDKKFRDFIGLPADNKYVFGTLKSRDALGHANPSRCQERFSKECENHVENHKHLRTRHLRMTFATRMVEMNLTYKTKKHMCAMMGHSLDVHERSYNKPQHLQVTATMGFALWASANNKLQHLKQKSIEDQLKLTPEEREQNELL
jgi:hypothetical protein